MRTNLTRSFATIALLAALVSPATGEAQVVDNSDNTQYGTVAAEFLLLGAGARGTALGGAYSALATDVTALYYNPAGVAQIGRPGAMVSSYSYLADTRYTWFGAAFPMSGGSRSVGVSLGSFGFSEQPVTTVENPDGDGRVYKVNQTFVAGSYAQNFSDRFSAGLSVKYIQDKLGTVTAGTFAVDFGTNFHALVGSRPLRAAFVISNLGGTLEHNGSDLDVTVFRTPPLGTVDVPQEPSQASLKTKDFGLPVMFRVSVALDLVAQANNRVTLLSEFSQPNNTKPGAGMGLEWSAMNLGNSGFSLAARGSYTIQPDNDLEFSNNAGFTTAESTGAFTSDGLAVGGGVGFSRGNFKLGFDYAFRDFGPVGGANFFSFSISW
jgi:hypothetical protein